VFCKAFFNLPKCWFFYLDQEKSSNQSARTPHWQFINLSPKLMNSQSIHTTNDYTQPTEEVDESNILHIVFGSRTGNSMAAAKLANAYAIHLGLNSQLHDMKTIDPSLVGAMKNILIAVSTHGEGDPPAVVESFYHHMHSSKAPDMTGSRFSILALGDSSYKDYCKTGYDFRSILLQLGSIEISPLVACDIDYEQNAMKWVREAVDAFEKVLPGGNRNEKEFAFEINKIDTDQDKLFYAEVIDVRWLTNPEFQKRTMHLALSTENFGSDYQPGDAFGIYAQNSRLLVDKLLKSLGFDGTNAVQSGDKIKLLKEALINDFELTLITPLVATKYAEATKNRRLLDLINNKKELESYCENRDVLDLVTDYGSHITPQVFVDSLRKLSPRLYSVANSPLAFKNEVHFTIGLMEYAVNNRQHSGVCSTYFADRIEVGDSIPIYLETNEKFRIPAENDRPIIMISTGTGVAPFRGFLQQRDYQQAKGENWLFFGDRNSKSDFLYRSEIENFFNKGLLTRLNTAFSRDQADKVYVHHLMLSHRQEIYRWIHQKEAAIYICGNKRTMGRSVKEALQSIIRTEGKLTQAQTTAYIENLKAEKRYQTDLY
jgi:sulfite reductase (NADPH) flavoprotein alpha-component